VLIGTSASGKSNRIDGIAVKYRYSREKFACVAGLNGLFPNVGKS